MKNYYQTYKILLRTNWLYDNVLINKKVIAVSGTHGKTTTSSLITSILKFGKLNPSYLIGGMPVVLMLQLNTLNQIILSLKQMSMIHLF